MSFTQMLNEFRSSLHVQLDKAFEEGSKVLLNEIIDVMIINNKQQQLNIADVIQSLSDKINMIINNKQPQLNIADAIRSLSDRIDRIDNSRQNQVCIPEVYHTKLNLADVVQTIQEVDDQDNNKEIVQEDYENTVVEENEYTVVEENEDTVVEENEDTVVEENEDTVVEENEDEVAQGEVVDDDTIPEEDEGEAEEEEEEEEEEEQEDILQELEVDGKKYYYDSQGNIYELNENGEPGEPIGTYDEEMGEFALFELEEEDVETLEEIIHKGKIYFKDSENNVYNAECQRIPYTYVNGRFVKV